MIIFFIDELATVAEIHNKDLVGFLAQPYQKVIRIDIIVDEVFRMYPFNTINQLIRN